MPLLYRKIKPNPSGVRVPKTLNNPEIWYSTNAYSARYLFAAGGSIVVAAVLLYFIPGLSVDTYALGCLGVFGVVFGFGLFQIFRFLRRQ
jgi:hypothetical protein